MLQNIRSGHFDPNASRSGMMITEVKQEEVVIEDDAGFELVSDNQVALDEEAGAEPGSGSDTTFRLRRGTSRGYPCSQNGPAPRDLQRAQACCNTQNRECFT